MNMAIDPKAIDAALDDLREARRYVTSDPGESARLANRGIEAARGLIEFSFRIARISQNIGSGIHFIMVDPDVLRGYLTGAILEIQDIISNHE